MEKAINSVRHCNARSAFPKYGAGEGTQNTAVFVNLVLSCALGFK